jgi:hypothetical protein
MIIKKLKCFVCGREILEESSKLGWIEVFSWTKELSSKWNPFPYEIKKHPDHICPLCIEAIHDKAIVNNPKYDPKDYRRVFYDQENPNG